MLTNQIKNKCLSLLFVCLLDTKKSNGSRLPPASGRMTPGEMWRPHVASWNTRLPSNCGAYVCVFFIVPLWPLHGGKALWTGIICWQYIIKYFSYWPCGSLQHSWKCRQQFKKKTTGGHVVHLSSGYATTAFFSGFPPLRQHHLPETLNHLKRSKTVSCNSRPLQISNLFPN